MSACGNLHAATLELVKGTNLKQRLTVAFSKHLSQLDPTEFPVALRDEFVGIVRGLEAVRPLPGESAVQATVRKMSAEETDRCARRIVGLFGELARLGVLQGEDEKKAPRPLTARDRDERREDGGNTIPLLYAVEA